jgi:hypothetical protein
MVPGVSFDLTDKENPSPPRQQGLVSAQPGREIMREWVWRETKRNETKRIPLPSSILLNE